MKAAIWFTIASILILFVIALCVSCGDDDCECDPCPPCDDDSTDDDDDATDDDDAADDDDDDDDDDDNDDDDDDNDDDDDDNDDDTFDDGILENGDFDDGPGFAWLQQSPNWSNMIFNQSESPIEPHTPEYLARLGGYNGAEDQIWQSVLIPGDALSATVSCYVRIYTQESLSSAYDYVTFMMNVPTQGAVTLGVLSNVDAVSSWTMKAWNVADFSGAAGQTVDFIIYATTDFSNTTHFLIDSCSLFINL